MATLVCFHAHPDDESIATGGTMAKAAADGHRVVLVVATRGEQGEPVAGVLRDSEQLWERRVVETDRSAAILGVSAVHFLGYEDSGMMGEPTNDNPACFWQADHDDAVERLADILRAESCDVLTVYDEIGGYGHPDHLQVHRIGHAAAERAGVGVVFESTMNRTRIMAMMASAEDIGFEMDAEDRPNIEDEESFGMPEERITHAVDVAAYVDTKRSSMTAHESQISDESFFLKMPPEAFAMAFGTEWFIRAGATRAADAPFGDDLFAELA